VRERCHLLVVVLVAALACPSRPAPATASPPPFDTVVLITVDTLRADRLGAYGQRQPTSPVFDTLAADSVLFERAAATCPATAPSVASILTGHHRAVHGVERNTSHLRRDVRTLPEILRHAGFRTAAVVANPVLDRHGFEQGFDRYHMAPVDPRRRALGPDAGVVKLAGRAVREAGDGPLFLWVHFMAPHGPYRPPVDHARRFRRWPYWWRGDRRLPLLPGNYGLGGIPRYQRVRRIRDPASLRALYDAEVRYTDELIGLFLGRLQRFRRWDRTLLVFTADHGESLGEHDAWFQHGWFAYDPTVRVPLLIRAPGRLAPGRVPASVSLLDLTPTVLALLDLPARPGIEGRSLLPVVEGRSGDRAAFTQTYYANQLTALTLGSWKYVRAGSPNSVPPGTTAKPVVPRPPAAGELLYDLATDPRETTDLTPERPAVRARLAARTDAWLRGQTALGRRRAPAPPTPQRSPREQRQLDDRLRELGYLD
jgi:arylsulfatase A-like enzyme